MTYTPVMVCHIVFLAFRLYLASLHYNENAGRPQATSAVGEPLFKMTFPKAKKGEYRVREVKTLPTFSMFFFIYILYKSV